MEDGPGKMAVAGDEAGDEAFSFWSGWISSKVCFHSSAWTEQLRVVWWYAQERTSDAGGPLTSRKRWPGGECGFEGGKGWRTA